MAPDIPPGDYQRASDLFNDLHDVADGELDAALDAACAGNAALRSRVLLLLHADRGAAGFLERGGAMRDAALMLQAGGGTSVPETIAHYRILSKLGEGGMGEVWRAHDSKLERDVAIKILPRSLAADPDRMARFKREAQVLASLSHPNIAVIYGVEDGALVMELLDGPTLAARIKAGPLPWDEAAEIACQLAGALEAAHERGVVHRDLKPANVKVTSDGHVKVLDFGLARAQRNEPAPGEPSSPTMVAQGSMAGMILGTAAYMSPEQAKGKVVDRRADIWSFGVVLFEMLTGRNPFQCETVPETLAAVLKAETDLESVPAVARPIVERCLRRDPRRRWQSIGDARIAIEEALAGSPDVPAEGKTRWPQRLLWAAAGLVTAAAVFIPVALFLQKSKPLPAPVEFTVYSPGDGSFPMEPVLRVSPNGESILFVAQTPDNDVRRAYLYNVATGTTRELPGTDGTMDGFWSFDSRSLLLSRSGMFSRMDIDANSPQPLPFESGYSSWGPDGVVTATRDGLEWFRPETPGSRLLMRNNLSAGADFLVPSLLLPGTGAGPRWMLYNSFNGTPSSGVSVRIASLNGREQRKLFNAERAAVYAAPGYVLYLRGAELMARAIDPASGQLRGGPVPVAGPVERPLGAVDTGTFSASNNGVLAFRRSGVSDFRMVWFDRSGKRLGTAGGIADYSNPALSPDGNRLAVSIRDPATGNRDIWILDLARGTSSRITFDAADHTNTAWSPDGQRIAYSSDRRGARDIYTKNASGIGADQLLIESGIPKNVEDWSADGRWIVYNEAVPNNSDDLVVLSLDTRKPVDFLRTRFQEDRGSFSPDGKWMAYQSYESGRAEVYIQPFPPTGEKWQISNDNGSQPEWRGDGRELYYSVHAVPARMMAVDIVAKDHAIHAGIPHPLFEAVMQDVGARNCWVVTRDGQKFLAVVPVNEKRADSFRVIVNWPSLVRKR
jgi:serine/threonine protein kinase